MKLSVKLIGVIAAAPLLFAGIASAAPRSLPRLSTADLGYTTVAQTATDPACPGTYDHVTTVFKFGSAVNLQTGNNLVYVNTAGNWVVTAGGNDCVIVNSDNNGVSTNGGADTIVGNGNGNFYNSGGGNDTIKDNGLNNFLLGGAGVDTCTYDAFSSGAFSCEL